MTLRGKLFWVAILYFAEGMPFGIVKDLLPVYFRDHGVSLTEIGLMSLLGLPWTLKVIWSPLVDRYGERSLWIRACLLALLLLVALVPFFDAARPSWMLWAVLLAFTVASATQDVAIDAFTIGLVDRGEEGQANGVRVSAYRVALIASGGVLVILSEVAGWQAAFLAAAACFAGLAALLSRLPPVAVPVEERRRWLEPIRRWVYTEI